MAGRDQLSSRVRCERARHWASLRLDGELSHLEEQLLERHLAQCEECRRLDAGMSTTTALLRNAPAEMPSRRLRVPAARSSRFPLERRRRTALLAAAALALGALVGSIVEGPSAPAPQAPRPEVSLLTRDVGQLRDLPRLGPAAPAPTQSRPPNPPEGVI
jgi:predicted anti-sigma-YlaC factor YlaD